MIILASQSPRRSEILRQAGIPFVVRSANVDETPLHNEDPENYVKRVAELKAMAIECGASDVVLGADTVVVIDGRMLGKPSGLAEAATMLRSISGRKHEVITGVCLKRGQQMTLDWAVTLVWFMTLTEDEIREYVASGEPLDKAGAYAVQGLASKFVEKIEGSYTNIVGLPVELVYKHLRGELQRCS